MALVNRQLISGLRASSLASTTSRPFLPRRAFPGPRFYSNGTRRTSQWAANACVGGSIATCVSVFAYNAYAKDRLQHGDPRIHRWVHENLVLNSKNVREGRYWTLLTHTFMHSGLYHLGANMLGLWCFGRPLALLYGAPAFVAMWVGAGVTGAVASLLIQKEETQGRWGSREVEQNYIGASGSVLGFSAAFACAFPYAKLIIFPIPIPVSSWVATLGFAAYSIFAQTNGLQNNIGHLGHLGGMGFGALYWLLLLR